jgi:metal-responsive CopG/Arc/MetJ family transcriptional regulator
MPESFVLLSVIVPEQLAVRLADVCQHSEQSRAAVVRDAIEVYVSGYITGSGLTED